MLRFCNQAKAFSNRKYRGEPSGGVRMSPLSAPLPTRVEYDAEAGFDGAGVQSGASEVICCSRVCAVVCREVAVSGTFMCGIV